MSRSGYIDDCEFDNWAMIRWRGAVASAIRGKRGQAFLKEMRDALDALSEPKLIADELEANGLVCAIGSVGKARGIDMSDIDPEDFEDVAATFGIPEALAREIVFMNDEVCDGTPEERFARIRKWTENKIRGVP